MQYDLPGPLPLSALQAEALRKLRGGGELQEDQLVERCWVQEKKLSSLGWSLSCEQLRVIEHREGHILLLEMPQLQPGALLVLSLVSHIHLQGSGKV